MIHPVRAVHGAAVQCRTSAATFWAHLTLAEVSGALGDLGTFLPLLVGLVKTTNLDLGTTLLFTGLYNIATGLLMDVPMPVQPMKTIAAVALAEAGSLTIPQIMAAGIFVSSCILFLGATGLMGLVIRLIPAPVVRGMQLGLGLNLAMSGWRQVWYANSKNGAQRQWWTTEGLFLGLATVVFILMTVYTKPSSRAEAEREAAAEEEGGDVETAPAPHTPGQGSSSSSRIKQLLRNPLKPLWAAGEAASAACDAPLIESSPLDFRPAIPAALIIVVAGVVMVMVTDSSVLAALSLGPSMPQVVVPSAADWRQGILRAGLPQLPLTAFNSVLSVCQLAQELFPAKREAVRPAAVATSVGAMNLVGCWFGAMPCCHGAGGLAAQVRFGARSGAAPIFLGLVKLVLALALGSSLFELLKAFPAPLLGAMLVFAGVELASVAKGQRGQRGIAVMSFTAAVVLAMSNVAVGVVAGLAAVYIFAARDACVGRVCGWWQRKGNDDSSSSSIGKRSSSCLDDKILVAQVEEEQQPSGVTVVLETAPSGTDIAIYK